MRLSRVKKISIVVYCDGNLERTKRTLYSILDQKINHIYFDVLIIDDISDAKFSKGLNDFISKEGLVNFKVFSLKRHTGLPLSFSFLIKNKIINTMYTTILEAGSVLNDNVINYFLTVLYDKNYDLYVSNLKEVIKVPRVNRKGKEIKPKIVKDKNIISTSALTGPLTQNEMFVTRPVFLGKIWKTSILKRLRFDDEKILYQDIFMYFQMIMWCRKIWYEDQFWGKSIHDAVFPAQMDTKRIELLSTTLNNMISRNPYLNGHVLQLLALALARSSQANKRLYLLSNFKYLQNNYEIIKIYNLSKRKVLKLTKPFIERGEINFKQEKEENKAKNKKQKNRK